MAFNVSDVIEPARRELTETSAREWTNAELTDYIRDAVHCIWEVASFSGPSLIESFDTVTVTANTSTVTLTNTPLRILGVMYYSDTPTTDNPVSGVPLSSVFPHDIQFNGQVGIPAYYALEGMDTLRVYPQPESDTILVVRNVHDVPEVAYDESTSTDSSIALPDAFIRMCKEYCIVRAYNRRELDPQLEGAAYKALHDRARRFIEARVPARPGSRGFYGGY